MLLCITVLLMSVDVSVSLVVFGIASLIFWHVLVNIGMVIGVLPVVGLTLPLISYGGSSVLIFLASLGIVAGISGRLKANFYY